MLAGPRITAIVAAFNEADIIQQTVGDLVRQGIAVHVIDDRSTDGTVAALEPLMATGLVQVERCSQQAEADSTAGQFKWARLLARKEQLARELDSDWFLHQDADEFRESPWRHLDLRQGIELVDRLGYNAIDFAVLNFWPTHDGFDGRADIREVFQHFERGADFDRVQVRCWKKAADVDLQSSGGHDVRFQSRRVFPLRFLMRHFPVRSQAHGHRKVFEERKPRFSDDERGRGWHVQYDGLDESHRFTRDPDTLEAYDPDAVRARLQIEHRGVEGLTARLESLDQALRDEQAARAVEVSALRLEVAARTEEVQRLAADLAGHVVARQELEQRYGDLDQRKGDLDRRYGDLERRHAALDHRTAELQRQFEQLEQRYRDLDRHSQELERERGQLLHGVEALEQQLLAVRKSWSWKLTAPLRALGRPRTP